MKKKPLRPWVRGVVFLCGIGLMAVIFLPIWKIELSAPQYPEGLVLKIFAGKLAGDVDVVNGLNHYIGMKTLHANDFVEFTVLPYIIVFFSLLIIITGLVNRRRLLVITTFLYLAFAITSMADFWKWEYDYGHHLDPKAAIQVPGMTYQPPLIGYKQLLNFGAYSIPDSGGFIFIGVGVLLLVLTILEWKWSTTTKPAMAKAGHLALLFVVVFLCSCNVQPKPIKVGSDHCDHCKMTIADNRFGGEILTAKGKVYKFDDARCLQAFWKSADLRKKDVKDIYLVDFIGTHELINLHQSFLFYSPQLRTPMGGNIAAFSKKEAMEKTMREFNGSEIVASELLK